jgi:hypothetical protein
MGMINRTLYKKTINNINRPPAGIKTNNENIIP